MAIWRERAPLIKHRFISREKLAAVLYPGVESTEPCLIEIQEYVGSGEPGPLGWRPNPDNTVVNDYGEMFRSANIAEGKVLAKQILADAIAGKLGTPLAKRPYVAPAKGEFVETAEHPSGRGRSVIKKWPDDRYEIDLLVFALDGLYMPVSTPSVGPLSDMSWGRVNMLEKIYCDSIEEARSQAERLLADAVEEADRLTQERRKLEEQ